MKLLLIHNYYRTSSPSGEDNVARNESKLLEKNGIDVVRYEKFNDVIDESSMLKRLRLGFEYARSGKTYHEVSSLIKQTEPDIAHVHSLHPQITPSVYTACHDLGIPVVHTLHNYRYICPGALLFRDGRSCEDCIGKFPFSALRHRCYRDSLPATGSVVWMIVYNRLRGILNNHVDRYIALTNFAKSRLTAGGLPAERIDTKPNFLPDPPLAGNGSGNYAVFVGRLSKEKGLHTLLSAWTAVDDMDLKVIGDGTQRSELEAQARREGTNIAFLGMLPRKDVLAIVGEARMQLVPSEWYEGFPMVIVEAYACGTPVIASRIGSLNEIVLDGETGVKFEPGNPQELAEKINSLAHDKQTLATMRRKARRLFEEKYTAERNFSTLMEIYQRARENFEKLRERD
jgi:glycosyltransferase involved in cell wall biosynthesis